MNEALQLVASNACLCMNKNNNKNAAVLYLHIRNIQTWGFLHAFSAFIAYELPLLIVGNSYNHNCKSSFDTQPCQRLLNK